MHSNYPVLEVLDKLKEALRSNRVVILQAPPGAGKSTVLPLHLIQEPWLTGNKIILSEPRRLAARSVALRMSELLHEDAGTTVGYRVRFESKTSDKTKIEVVTEGILLRYAQEDSTLAGIGLVVFDEFHERSLQADLALAICLQIQKLVRDDLRILIMSATLDTEKISTLLGNAPVISSSGKQHPVAVHYSTEKDLALIPWACRSVKKALKEQTGDLLVFLPGAGEIKRVAEQLEAENLNAVIHPLYGDLPFKQQQQAILPRTDGIRKIVLATSIAETSLTIEGITAVIDAGYSRVPRFDPRSGLSKLETVRVTMDAANQRAGRAGRLGPGVCYRLWTEAVQRTLQPVRQPEILEADLAPLVLELAAWGAGDVKDVNWITLPPAGAVEQAKELLQDLEAIDENFRITSRGKEMAAMPTHPRISHMLLSAFHESSNAIALAADIAAVLEERDPLPRESGADLTVRIEILRRWRTGDRVRADVHVLERMERLASSWRKWFKVPADNALFTYTDVGKWLSEAYPERIARQIEKHSVRFKLANGRIARLPEHDPLVREAWLAIAQIDSGGGEGKIFMAAALDEQDLQGRSKEIEAVKWDAEKGLITAFREQQIGGVVLSRKPLGKISDERRVKVLCTAFREEGIKLLNWTEAHDQWCARVLSLRKWRPAEPWPDVSRQTLIATVEDWLPPYLIQVSNRQDFFRLDMSSILSGLLSWELGPRLDVLAPSRLQVPSASWIKLTYSDDGQPPVMEVRLQEVFGLVDTPTVNEGRIKIVMHLLSPGYKPVQITQDLKSFWHTTYHEVRKELRMRYPKHHWPEDPWTAQAVRGALRKKS